MDENLAWLTEKTEDPKSNKRNLTFTTQKFCPPQFDSNDSIFGRSYLPPPPFNKSVGWGVGGGGLTMQIEHRVSEQNPMVVGSNPTQVKLSMATSKNPSVISIYIIYKMEPFLAIAMTCSC